MSQPRLPAAHAAEADAILARLRAAERVLLPTHINVDGDSLGSVLALGRALAALGTPVVPIIADGQVPHHLQSLLEEDGPLLYTGQPLPPTDLALLVDITGLGRLGAAQAALGDRLGRERVLTIDHHVSNERFGAINLIMTAAASTAEIVYLVLRHWGLPVTPAIATPLLAGVLTDTLGFQTSSTTPGTLRIAADLIEAGAPLARLNDALLRVNPLATARLFGSIVANARLEEGVLWSEVTPAMLAATGARASDTEGAIRYLSGVQEAVVFALLYEQPTGWRVSLRSNSDAVDVAALAGRYGGGGHRRAAGLTLTGGAEVRADFLAAVRAAVGQAAAPAGAG